MTSRTFPRSELSRILSNSSWMVGEQIFRVAAALYVSVLLARYLGPEGFGALNYTIAYWSLFAIVATVGLNRILVRELAKHENDLRTCEQLITTVFFLRLGAGVVVYLLSILIAVLTQQPHLLLIAIVSGTVFFSAADVVDLFYQARSASHQAIRIRLTVVVVTTLVRTLLVWAGAGLTAFACVVLLEGILIPLGMLALYRGKRLLPRSQFSAPLAKRLLSESWPEILAGLGALIFVRIDQIMLANMIDTSTVGVYSVAVRLSESWYFIPAALVASSFPAIVRLRDVDPATYVLRLGQLMRGITVMSYAAAVLVLVAGRAGIELLFGASYASAATILTIHIWSGLFVSLGLVSGSWIVAEGRTRLNLYRNLLGAAVNITLNLVLIPTYGAVGAAYATLIAVFAAYFLFDFIAPGSRPIAYLKARSLLPLPSMSAGK